METCVDSYSASLRVCFLHVLFSDYNYFSLPKQGLGLQFCETQESSLAQESFFWAHGLITLGIPKPADMMKSDIPLVVQF